MPPSLENSFLSGEQFASELYLIFNIVDKGVYMFGSLVGYQEKMEDQLQNWADLGLFPPFQISIVW